MYTRAFYPEGEEAAKALPENYGGVTFSREESPAAEEAAEVGAFGPAGSEERKSPFSAIGRLPFLQAVSGMPFLSSLKVPKIGTEELLLIGAALYLFFSKDGDRECAIILLLLLFIG